MADRIMVSTKILDADNNILAWDYAYIVTSGDNENNFCVRVDASEMTNVSDESEAKMKANLKAKNIKDAWVATLSNIPTVAVVSTTPQDVTL